MNIKVYPGKLNGTVAAPPSKSMAHRALICASLAEGESIIRGISESDDMKATIGCMRELGAVITEVDENGMQMTDVLSEHNGTIYREKTDIVRVTGIGAGAGNADSVHINADKVNDDKENENAGGRKKIVERSWLDCIESGSTLRFLLPVAAALGNSVSFTGRGKLPERPMTSLADEMKKKGIEFLPEGRDSLPFGIEGKLESGLYELPGDVSSQYISGLMFALPLLDGNSEIKIKGRLESYAYIELTLKVIQTFGISMERTENGFLVPGNQVYHATDFVVEGDYSNAAFWIVAGSCAGGSAGKYVNKLAQAFGKNVQETRVELTGLNKASMQGDKRIIDIMKQAGADISESSAETANSDGDTNSAFSENPASRDANAHDTEDINTERVNVVIKQAYLNNIEIDGSDIPDIIPILAVAATSAAGKSHFYNIGRLKIKESDRLSAIADCLTRLGAEVSAGSDELTILGGSLTGGCEVDGYGDHRIVMSMAIAALTCTSPIVIRGAEAVSKSYPEFFEEFRRLGGKADVISDR